MKVQLNYEEKKKGETGIEGGLFKGTNLSEKS